MDKIITKNIHDISQEEWILLYDRYHISELSKIFNVSRITIRRKLNNSNIQIKKEEQ